ncbi:hypothetical protein K7432_009720 [Basidiobolus ranarum]|uniref:BZIP domain-containing protein n=1 Tax=Basidiobolus ranarum TaxID=34480 RepID=A0ABR2WPT4_9FUNG
MSETASRLGIPRTDFSEADIGAPTPTRFLLECGEYRLTPSLSSFGEINPFEASFTSCGKKDSTPASNTNTSHMSVAPSAKATSVAVNGSMLTSVPGVMKPIPSVTTFDSEKLVRDNLHQFIHSKPSEPVSESRITSKSMESMNDQYSSSDESQLDGYDGKANGFKKRGSNNPDKNEEKRRRFLERNRVAASKCRQKKKIWVKELEHKSDEITARNKNLQHIVGQLKEELLQLKSQLLGHRNCNCNVIQQYVQTSGHFSQLPQGDNESEGAISEHISQASVQGMLSKQSNIPTGPSMGGMVGVSPYVNN